MIQNPYSVPEFLFKFAIRWIYRISESVKLKSVIRAIFGAKSADRPQITRSLAAKEFCFYSALSIGLWPDKIPWLCQKQWPVESYGADYFCTACRDIHHRSHAFICDVCNYSCSRCLGYDFVSCKPVAAFLTRWICI